MKQINRVVVISISLGLFVTIGCAPKRIECLNGPVVGYETPAAQKRLRKQQEKYYRDTRSTQRGANVLAH
jgi:hypothetical protein